LNQAAHAIDATKNAAAMMKSSTRVRRLPHARGTTAAGACTHEPESRIVLHDQDSSSRPWPNTPHSPL
jgi:hypothetical protein